MTEHMEDVSSMTIGVQAAEWLLRWHSGELSLAERFEYLQWLKSSPVHIAETLRMCRVYSWLESTRLQSFITNEEFLSNVVQLPVSEAQYVDPLEVRLERAVRLYPVDTDTLVRDALDELAQRRWWRVTAAAAAVVLAAVALIWGVQAIVPAREIATGAAQWRTVDLEDGTEVTLGPHSQMLRAHDEINRTVLLRSGEAFFRIAKDARPFLVDAESVIVRAMGTSFAVSRRDVAVTVTVEEGRVVVAPQDRPSESLPVAAGEQVTVAGEWPVPVRSIDTTRALAWVRGRLKFEAGDTFGSAVAEFNRRNVTQIELDPKLAERPVIGEFDATDPLSFAQSAGREPGIELTTSADSLRLEVRQQPPGEPERGARDDR